MPVNVKNGWGQYEIVGKDKEGNGYLLYTGDDLEVAKEKYKYLVAISRSVPCTLVKIEPRYIMSLQLRRIEVLEG